MAISSIEGLAPDALGCSASCPNKATEWHNFNPYCYPHYLAVKGSPITYYDLMTQSTKEEDEK